jgi:hypothetical protein
MKNTGFETDSFSGDRIQGLKLGRVVDRGDPRGLCRIRATIPGLMEVTPWARPRGGGSKNRGKADVPPLGADVYVQFLNDDPRMPVYEPADHVYEEGESNVFPEHTDPDIHVFGIGPFRIVIDNRDPEVSGVPRTCRWKMVKEIGGEEQDIVWAELSEENSFYVHADSAVGIEAGAIVDVDASAVQIKKRKVMDTTRPIG